MGTDSQPPIVARGSREGDPENSDNTVTYRMAYWQLHPWLELHLGRAGGVGPAEHPFKPGLRAVEASYEPAELIDIMKGGYIPDILGSVPWDVTVTYGPAGEGT